MNLFAALPEIVVGPAVLKTVVVQIGELAPEARCVLLVCDAALRENATVLACIDGLAEAGLDVAVHAGVAGEPTLADVDRGASAAYRVKADLVLGVGGGSVIDLAKLIAAVGCRLEPAAHYVLGAKPLPDEGPPVIAVPTTAGAGAEMMRAAVALDESGRKFWFHGEVLKPDGVLLDPELGVSLPPGLTAASGLDALVHAVGAVTGANAFPGNNLYALEAARLVRANLSLAVETPGDLAAREAMLMAACWAGVAIDNTGCSIAHSIGNALTSMAPIRHGIAVAIALLATLPVLLDRQQRYDDAAVGKLAAIFGSDEAGGLQVALDRFVRDLGVDVSLAEAGLSGGDAGPLAELMLEPQNRFGFEGAGLPMDVGTAMELATRVLGYR